MNNRKNYKKGLLKVALFVFKNQKENINEKRN